MSSEQVLTMDNVGGLPITYPGEEEHHVKMLLYGDPGVGKTVLAGSSDAVPEMQKVLYLNIEGGTLSLKRHYPKVATIRITKIEQFNHVYKVLRTNTEGWNTVVIDTGSEVQKQGLYEIMQSVVKEDPDRDPDLPQFQDWGKSLEQMRRITRAFRDLPMHVIMTAHAQNEYDGRGNVRRAKPAFTGKFANECAGFFDLVAYMYVKAIDGEDTRCLLTKHTERQVAKDRSGILPSVIVEPTMEKIISGMKGKAS